jgi:hypothetical protein
LKISVRESQVATLRAALVARGEEVGEREARSMEPMLPGAPPTLDDLDREWDEHVGGWRSYATGLRDLAVSQEEALAGTTPILFDPLSAPQLDERDIDGLRLPFPVTTCDFLARSGMSMPVELVAGLDGGDWVGLVAATLEQKGDTIDIWPVVTTLHPRKRDEHQNQRTLLFGRVRFGGQLPEPPDGLTLLNIGSASAWVLADDERCEDIEMWTQMWVLHPAYAAASALRLLEAANVDVQETSLPRAERRRAQREGAEPSLEVVIRTAARHDSSSTVQGIEWQHRWTVRGHWKHFSKGPIFDANPRKRVLDANGSECVKVWCPPFVKGPADKPLVLKSRRAPMPERAV